MRVARVDELDLGQGTLVPRQKNGTHFGGFAVSEVVVDRNSGSL